MSDAVAEGSSPQEQQIAPPINFGLFENSRNILFLFEEKIAQIQNLRAEDPNFWGTVKIVSTHNVFCRKIATSCPAYFDNPRRRCA